MHKFKYFSSETFLYPKEKIDQRTIQEKWGPHVLSLMMYRFWSSMFIVKEHICYRREPHPECHTEEVR